MAQLPSDDSGDSGESENTSDDKLNRRCQTEDVSTSTSDVESGPDEEESVAEEDLTAVPVRATLRVDLMKKNLLQRKICRSLPTRPVSRAQKQEVKNATDVNRYPMYQMA